MVALRGELLSSVTDTIANLQETIARPGDTLWIPRNRVHVSIPLGRPVTIIDAAFGDNPREDDIVRIYDRNGRDTEIPGVEPLPTGKYAPGISVRAIWKALQ